jgi:TonB family protein
MAIEKKRGIPVYGNRRKPENNFTSLAMIASLGFHGILFTGLAFLPASSKASAPEKLRIVNLLPPLQSSGNPQANTSALGSLYQNPLPDLGSAGLPPIGSFSGETTDGGQSTAVYEGSNRRSNNPFGSPLSTKGLATADVPNRAFPPIKSSGPQSSGQGQIPASNYDPNWNPNRTQSPPNVNSGVDSNALSENLKPGNQTTAVNPATGLPWPVLPAGSGVPGENPGPYNPNPTANPQPPANNSNPSNSNVVTATVLSLDVPFSYPPSACGDRAEGAARIDFFLDEAGNYVPGSAQFLDNTGNSDLDRAALDAVKQYAGPPNSSLQRYVTRMSFKPDGTCQAASPTPGTDPSPIVNPDQSPSTPASPSVKPNPPAANSPTTSPEPTTSPTSKPEKSIQLPPPKNVEPIPAETDEPTVNPEPTDSLAPPPSEGSAEDLVVPESPPAPDPEPLPEPESAPAEPPTTTEPPASVVEPETPNTP